MKGYTEHAEFVELLRLSLLGRLVEQTGEIWETKVYRELYVVKMAAICGDYKALTREIYYDDFKDYERILEEDTKRIIRHRQRLMEMEKDKQNPLERILTIGYVNNE